jgi:hypothetical protein
LVNVAKSTGHTIKLVGNTDGKGSDSYNMDLSKRRVDKSSRSLPINWVGDLSHHRAYRSVHGGSNV